MLLENIKLALSGLLANKLRTFLTMLGIIIGIASVITIMNVADAMKNSTMSQMGDMGVNNISFYLSQKPDHDTGEYSENIRAMKDKDYFSPEMLSDVKGHFSGRVSGISLSRSIADAKIENGKKYANVSIEGLNEEGIKNKKFTIISGRNITAKEQEDGRKVALVSDRLVNNLFGGDTGKALGKQLEAVLENKYYNYTIVGVYEYVESAAGGYSAKISQRDLRTGLYIPLKCAVKQARSGELYENFDVIAATGEDQGSLATEIMEYINTKYYDNNDAYEAYGYSMKEEIKSMESMLNTQTYAFMAVGAISLLVGGIGVMNIMVVSITERTKEIGTRKALGATNGYIRLQFITEAVVICLIGGILGIITGELFGFIASKFLGASGNASVSGIILCVLFSMIFGVFFGFYPANKAARLNPIEALRYE
ncbi:ABC transporter permease [Butyrivibrio sp. AE3004]|uniref:ABC transporter permease n=1 Tax=Butyrivibrio sp. AE3004 TaxID=1506994 RepID=UPI0004949032|nr:ABC transporter permease [Butyrivibrio sp. AE3004]